MPTTAMEKQHNHNNMSRKRPRSEWSEMEVLVGSPTRRVEGLILRKALSQDSGSLHVAEQFRWRDLQEVDNSTNTTTTFDEQLNITNSSNVLDLLFVNTTNSSEPVDPIDDIITNSSISVDPMNNATNSTLPPVEEVPDNRTTEDTLYQLETTFSGSNGNNGAMFDVSLTEGDHEIKIVSLDVHANLVQEDCPIIVYGRPGSHIGFENTTLGWALLVNTTVDCKGFGERTVIPPSAFQDAPILKSGQMYSFYTQMPTPNIRYINGQVLGAIYSSNEHLNVHEGTGVAEKFGGDMQGFVRPRVWNGVVLYELLNNDPTNTTDFSEGCDLNLTTTYEDNLGSFGNMFDIATQNSDIEVHGIDIYTDLLEPITYEIFTRQGTYVNAMYLEPSERLDETEVGPSNGLAENVTITNVENMRGLNWTLVKRGTVIGGGSGQGTAIRNFVPFIVPANSLQGFYVTLTKADIRYKDVSTDIPDARVGDLYFENDDLEIHMGVSVGTYPGGSTYYGPRVWSGSIIYTADKACPSEVPSDIPSSVPSSAPSDAASSVPSLDDPDYGNCTDVSTLKTTLTGGTGSYGNMFTVTSKESISVTSLDLNAATTDMVYVEVYTRDGDYRGFSDSPSFWRIVAAVNVTGAGNGEPTPVPDEAFDDVHIGANETRAFYVTLSTADLKYTRTSTEVGGALVSDKFLSINAGAGLAAQSFGGPIFEPRIFNGAVHYRHEDDCIEDIITTVVYNFNIQHDASIAVSEVAELVNENVLATVSALIEIDAELRTYTAEHDLELTTVVTQKTDTSVCAATNEGGACTTLETKVVFSHEPTLDQGNILLTMLQYRDTIGINLNLAEFEAVYDGEIPVQSDMVISLQGNFTAGLSDSERLYFQAITRAYLNDQLARKGVSVLNVAVASVNDRRFLQRNDDDAVVSSGNSIDITTVVDGSYRPPPEIDFSAVVEDAIDAQDGGYQDDLTSGRRDVPQEIVDQVGAFQTVTSVQAETVSNDVSTSVPTVAPEVAAGSSTTAILGGAIGVAVVFFALLVWCYCKRNKQESSKFSLADDAMEAECAFVVAGSGQYMSEQYPGLPTKDEHSLTVSSHGSGTHEEGGGRKLAHAQQKSVQSLPAYMGGNRHDMSSSSHSHRSRHEMSASAHSRTSTPLLNRGISSRFASESSGRNIGRQQSQGTMSHGKAGMMAQQRNQNSFNGAMMIGGHRSMSSMSSFGRSTTSSGISMSLEKSMEKLDFDNAGRRSPSPSGQQQMMGRSMASMGSGDRSTSYTGQQQRMGRSMASMGSGDRSTYKGQQQRMGRSMASTGSGDRNTSSALHDRFEDEVLGHGARNSPHTSVAVSQASRQFGEDDLGSVSSDVGGFHPSYHHRDELPTATLQEWQADRPQNLYDSRANMSRPIMGGRRPG